MEPTITELNVTKTLLAPISVNGKTITAVTVKKLILRPVLKRIVAITEELDRVIIYDGETLFEAHKADSETALLTAMLTVIDTEHK